jgi:hypothetical protein
MTRWRRGLTGLATTMAALTLATGTAAAIPPDPIDPGPDPAECVRNSHGSITAPRVWGAGSTVKVSWSATPGCEEVYFTLNGSTVSASGYKYLTLSSTTKYTLMARMIRDDGSVAVATMDADTVAARRVVSYLVRSDGSLVVDTSLSVPKWRTISRTDAVISEVTEMRRRNFIGKIAEVHIIPTNADLTDLPDFAHLKGKTSSDGRLYDDIRGISLGVIGGEGLVAVGAEEMTGIPDYAGSYTAGYVLTHELGHLVLDGFASDFKPAPYGDGSLNAALDAQKSVNGDFLGDDAYTSSTVGEYWADGTAAVFDTAYGPAYEYEYTQAWLRTNDKGLYDLECSVYDIC